MSLLFFRRTSLVLLSISFLLMSMALFSGQTGGLTKVVGFYGITSADFIETVTSIVASLFAWMGIVSLLNVYRPVAKNLLAWTMLLFSVFPLVTLFGQTHWIGSLGGFPAIGSGQGIIKYFALAAIAVTLLRPKSLSTKALIWLNYFPVALVLLWIGGMKFTLLEAKGIEDLVATSPFMSWMYQVFDVQTASNVIGVYDLIALVLLAFGIRYEKLLWPGILMCGAVFVTTQTFLLSYPGSLEGGVLTSTGIFIIKDLWFVANLMAITAYRKGLH